MKYDCELIQDIAPLYQDGVLREKSTEIVKEHLSACAECEKYYHDLSAEADVPIAPASPTEDCSTQTAVAFSKKISTYRYWQVGLFLATLAFLFTMTFTWFGRPGLTAVSGMTVFSSNSLALIGVGLFLFAIWYHFRKKRNRLLCGYIGWGLIFFSVILAFLAVPFGYTTGIQIGFLHLAIPSFHNFELAECFAYAQPGFYIGVVVLLALGAVFGWFLKKTD